MEKYIVLLIWVIYGIPMWHLRYKWRSTVYRMYSWKINILPWFGKDIAALFSNRYFHTEEEIKMALIFRTYLIGYIALLILFLYS